MTMLVVDRSVVAEEDHSAVAAEVSHSAVVAEKSCPEEDHSAAEIRSE